MCMTCGCGDPKNKHGMKTLAAANKKFAKGKSKKKTASKELKGGQKKLDVAPPYGKLTKDDFDVLRNKGKKKK
jgi:hypothetical protein